MIAKLGFTLILVLLPQYIHPIASAKILQSICQADMSLVGMTKLLSTTQAYQIETLIASYFQERLTKDKNLAFKPLLVNVQLRDQSLVSGNSSSEKLVAQSTATLIYRSTDSRAVFLDEVLEQSINRAVDSSPFNTTIDGATFYTARFDFVPVESKTTSLYIENEVDLAQSSVNKGLIVASVLLSVMLVVVSSVLLYITGGFDIIQQALSNCLFEEVEEDNEHYLNHSKSTFHVQSTDEEDEESSATGVVGPDHNPVHGLGIKAPQLYDGEPHMATPGSDMAYSQQTTSTITPHTQSLGITSMRKLQPESPVVQGGGLAHTILSQFNSTYSNVVKK